MQSQSSSEVARSAVAAGLPYDVAQLQAWLEPLANQAQVECDGMTRLASHLLHKNGVEHIVAGGVLVDMQRLQDPEVGTEQNCGVTHWWLELGFGYIVDFRARMWMGPEAQHGVFIPAGGRFEYRAERRGQFNPLPEPLLDLMAGVCVGDWSPLMPTAALERK